MIVDTDTSSRAAGLDLPEWSSAEVLDTQLAGGLRLRALVCRLSAGKWQWSVSTLDRDRGELISSGIEQNATDARIVAMSEMSKCVENALE